MSKHIRISSLAILLLLSLVVLLVPNVSYATADSCETSWFSFLKPTCLIRGILGIIDSAVRFILTLFAYLLEVILVANEKILATPSVQIGFNISLAIANLGFVLGIVIIAISTILRFQSYAMKQVLWKLVVAALLVNFSLPIAGGIITFADGLTRYFMNIAAGGGTNGKAEFIAQYSGALGPNKVAGFKVDSTAAANLVKLDGEELLTAGILGIFSGIVMTIVMVIALGALVAMMAVRYVTIGILLVLMPFVWLFWIFPATHNMWSKWWNTFTRWVFFAPIVMFFIYLALATANAPNYLQSINDEAGKSRQSPEGAFNTGFYKFMYAFIPDFVTAVSGEAIVVALMFGGLFAANKLSITGAGEGMKLAKGAAAGFGSYVAGGGPARSAIRGAARATGSILGPPSPPKSGFRGVLQKINPVHRAREAIREATNKRLMFAGSRGSTVAKGLMTYGNNYEALVNNYIPKRSLIGSMVAGAKKKSGLFKKQKKQFKAKDLEDMFGITIEDGGGTTPGATAATTPSGSASAGTP